VPEAKDMMMVSVKLVESIALCSRIPFCRACTDVVAWGDETSPCFISSCNTVYSLIGRHVGVQGVTVIQWHERKAGFDHSSLCNTGSFNVNVNGDV